MPEYTTRLDKLSPGKRRLVRIALPFAVILFGFAVMRIFVATRTVASVAEPQQTIIPVTAVRVARGTAPVTIRATGTVTPSRSIRLEPQVNGRVIWTDEKLRPGGRFRAGQTMVRIDDRDYRVAAEQRQAALLQAQVALEIERGRKQVAEREWQIMEGMPASGSGRSLALREPQLREAEARVSAAEAALRQATLNIERTVLKAPFDCVVDDESTDVGQIARPGAPVATLIGSSEYWVKVAVPISDLPWLNVPGAEVSVFVDDGNGGISPRIGHAIEVLGSVERGGMMAQVLVAVDDPLGDTSNGAVPLLAGAVVDVELVGRNVEDVYEIPRVALRRNNTMWRATDADLLEVMSVEIVHRTPATLLVRAQASSPVDVVVSSIPTPIEGMQLEPRFSDGARADSGGDR
jgi:RND family efflux transporter MFP subunit